MMNFPKLSDTRSDRWVYGLLIPFIYLVVEFSFNHRLITALDETVSDAVLENLEFWGRLIAGVGLGLMIHRVLAKRTSYKFVSFVAAISLGIVLMWHLQQSLINYFVEIADPKDKRAAVLLNVGAARLVSEQFKTIQGESLINGPLREIDRNIIQAIFPAAAVHAKDRDKQLSAWLGEKLVRDATTIPSQIADNAFKNLIVPPVAIGASIALAILNLCAVLAFLLGRIDSRLQTPLLFTLLGLCIYYSLFRAHSFLDSPGYRNALEPGLWSTNLALALLVEWAGRASSAWGDISTLVHHFIAFDFAFGEPL
jgi:mannose/fructose/N-acetylgalactosamine-specific phosphotransferase system component IIC